MYRGVLLLGLLIGALSAEAQAAGVDRLYVLDCGAARAPDQSRWSPGVNVGQPIDIVDNCYLIHNAQGYLLWDSGIPDALFGKPPADGPIPWHRDKTLASQLAAIGVQPDDIKYVAISHTHADHVGNVDLFPKATVLIQQAEYDWAFAPDKKPPFSATHPADKLTGDKDVFGDGSVMIISTPGHTPGHESLLVDLPKTGWILLSGDAAHFRDNFDNRRVPSMNTDKEKTVTSMQHIADLVEKYQAQLWINHDARQAATIHHVPEFYD